MKIYVRGGLGMQVLELMVGLDVDISLSPRGTGEVESGYVKNYKLYGIDAIRSNKHSHGV
jgi:hypothetical protein